MSFEEKKVSYAEKRPVRVSDGDTCQTVKYPSMAAAARGTGIPARTISAVCRYTDEGGPYGKVVNGKSRYYIRFASDSEDDQVKLRSSSTSRIQDSRLSSSKEEQQEEEEIFHHVASIPDVRSPSSLSKKRQQHAPMKLIPFDISTLKPLTQTSKSLQKSKYKIELVCKLTEEVQVCFSNKYYASQALGCSASAVHRICKLFGKPFHQDDKLPYCHLRYVSNSNSYEYGKNPRDFDNITETHAQRADRWAKNLQQSSYQVPDDISSSSSEEDTELPPHPKVLPPQRASNKKQKSSRPSILAAQEGSDSGSSASGNNKWLVKQATDIRTNKKAPQSVPSKTYIANPTSMASSINNGNKKRLKPTPPSSKGSAKQLARQATNSRQVPRPAAKTTTKRAVEQAQKPIPPKRVPTKQLSEEQRKRRLDIISELLDEAIVWPTAPPSALCLACQNVSPTVIFFPCHHCIICQSCMKRGVCPDRCATCQVPIESRLFNTNDKALWIQPNIVVAKQYVTTL